MKLNPLMKTKRVRVAISVSPDFSTHIGHFALACFGSLLADKLGWEFHLRIDDIYARNAKDWNGYPFKKKNFPADNPHKAVPGRMIHEMRRPTAMKKEMVRSCQHLDNFFNFGHVYCLSDIEDAARHYFEDTDEPWLADLPIYFTEDLIWEKTALCRGEDWSRDGEHGYWVRMQEHLLRTMRDEKDFILTHYPHVKYKGQKISKSDSKYSFLDIRSMSSSLLQTYYEQYSDRANQYLNTLGDLECYSN